MNQTIEDFARNQIIDQCEALPAANQRIFKLMYGRKPDKRGMATRSVEDAELLSVRDVVAEIPAEKLDWALQQIENSHAKLAKRSVEERPCSNA